MTPVPGPLSEEEIKKHIQSCPYLGSLRSVNKALNQLTNAEYCFASQIADVICRDPTLTTRLLRLVNSVFFGFAMRISNIEDAILYLGIRQIRELALATPVIEELSQLHKGKVHIEWPKLWRHSIASAILCREILAIANMRITDDTDYLIGLLHNVGRIIIAFAFPDHLDDILQEPVNSLEELTKHEQVSIGWNHAKIGAYYLEQYQFSPTIVEAIRYYTTPAKAPKYFKLSAAIQIASSLARMANITGIEPIVQDFSEETILQCPGWKILFGEKTEQIRWAYAALSRTLDHLPMALNAML